jgi:hypothetical protein
LRKGRKMNLLVPHKFIPVELPKEGYVIKTVTMIGDADYYLNEELYLDEDISEEDFIKIFNLCLERQKNQDYPVPLEFQDFVTELTGCDAQSGFDGQLDEVDMFYYNDNGEKFSVKQGKI